MATELADLFAALPTLSAPAQSTSSPVEEDDRACPLCGKAVPVAYNARGVAILPDGSVRWACELCLVKAAPDAITEMSTHLITRDLPDCRECRAPYMEHSRLIGSVWDAFCDEIDTENGKRWRPSQPFRSRHWPYRIVVDSPAYTVDGKVAYALEAIAA